MFQDHVVWKEGGFWSETTAAYVRCFHPLKVWSSARKLRPRRGRIYLKRKGNELLMACFTDPFAFGRSFVCFFSQNDSHCFITIFFPSEVHTGRKRAEANWDQGWSIKNNWATVAIQLVHKAASRERCCSLGDSDYVVIADNEASRGPMRLTPPGALCVCSHPSPPASVASQRPLPFSAVIYFNRLLLFWGSANAVFACREHKSLCSQFDRTEKTKTKKVKKLSALKALKFSVFSCVKRYWTRQEFPHQASSSLSVRPVGSLVSPNQTVTHHMQDTAGLLFQSCKHLSQNFEARIMDQAHQFFFAAWDEPSPHLGTF